MDRSLTVGVAVSWMLEQIGRMREQLTGDVERLRKELAAAEAELADLDAAERVVTRVLAEAPAAQAPSGPRPGQVTVPERAEAAGPQDLPADYLRIWQILADAPGPLTAKDLCARLDLELTATRIEGVRSKLKRLSARGWVAEPQQGRFTAAG